MMGVRSLKEVSEVGGVSEPGRVETAEMEPRRSSRLVGAACLPVVEVSAVEERSR